MSDLEESAHRDKRIKTNEESGIEEGRLALLTPMAFRAVGNLAYLPLEIIVRIIKFLPVKGFLNFKELNPAAEVLLMKVRPPPSREKLLLSMWQDLPEEKFNKVATAALLGGPDTIFMSMAARYTRAMRQMAFWSRKTEVMEEALSVVVSDLKNVGKTNQEIKELLDQYISPASGWFLVPKMAYISLDITVSVAHPKAFVVLAVTKFEGDRAKVVKAWKDVLVSEGFVYSPMRPWGWEHVTTLGDGTHFSICFRPHLTTDINWTRYRNAAILDFSAMVKKMKLEFDRVTTMVGANTYSRAVQHLHFKQGLAHPEMRVPRTMVQKFKDQLN